MDDSGDNRRDILHVTAYAGTSGFGVGAVVRELSTAQSQINMSGVQVWSADTGKDRPEGFGDKVVWTCFPTYGPSRLAWAPGMIKLARTEDRPVVVHQHGIWTAVSAVTRLLHEQRGVPSVVAPHGSLQSWTLQRSRAKKAIALWLYERENLLNCSCLHALSPAELADCRAFGLGSPVAIIPNGVSEQWLASSGDASRFRLNHQLGTKTRLLLYVSRVTPKKGIPMLCQALASMRQEMREWTLVIVGPGESGYVSDLARLVHNLGLGESVLFTGPLFGTDKRDAFAAADAFVLPSHSEGLPMAVLEAMGLGLPVVVTEATPILEIEQNSCGWRVPADAGSLAGALAELAESTPDNLRIMGSNGRTVVLARYTWKQVAHMTLDLYDWLDGKIGRPSFVVEG